MVVGLDEAVWVPVQPARPGQSAPNLTRAVFPSSDSELEVPSGMWQTDYSDGMVCVINLQPHEVPLENRAVVEGGDGIRAEAEGDEAGKEGGRGEAFSEEEELGS